MEDFSLLRTLLDIHDELSHYALVPEEFWLALDELIYRTLEYDYNKMSEGRA